ncbi:MAG TPA: lipase family protein, partial [Rhodocyclaceae bacterium]
LAIRGTRSALEWAKDAEVTLDPSPWGPGAMVHHGFYSTYDSMRYQPKGQPLDERPAWAAVRDAVQGRPVTVAGHSLGAPLAIYLSLDMARAEQPVAGRYFAAPRAGNTALAEEVNRRVPDHLVFNNELDVVPYLPPRSDSYQPLANIALLPPRNDVLKIGDDIVCYHHAISYAALLQPALMSVDQWKQRLERSRQQAKCILAGAPA